MKIDEINIAKDQYLREVLPQIGTNTIINKTICGCGATTLELDAHRHSIIIEPNLPVILGKKVKHKFLFGVHEGVKTKHIEKYLYDNQDGYYKIMTTPESFGKVRKAIRNVNMNLYKDFFILFDECERTTQDIGYRKTITLPINDFFRSENKAMVSATPIIIEEPRFKEQDFKVIKITPTYDYRQNLTLVTTNNVFTALRKYLNELPENETVCFFHNSTDGIDQLIEYLNIKEQSNIYCSTESKEKLINRDYKNVSDKLNEVGENIKLNKYNFFTSRFYSAVDIELDYKPIVIMLTEVFSAPHSLIDPNTEAVQIAGRFRNGITKLIHITNYNRKVRFWTPKEKEKFLNEQHNVYSMFCEISNSIKEKGEHFILQQAKKRVDYAEFVLPNGEPNLFMYNNAFREEYIKMVYIRPDRILKEYKETNAFNIEYKPYFFSTTDKDREVINPPKSASQIKLNKQVLEQVHKLVRSKDSYDKEYLNQVCNSYKVICQGYEELGYDGIVKTGFKTKDILVAIERSKLIKQILSINVKREVYKVFKEHTRYTTSDINFGLMRIYDKFKVPYKKSGCSDRINFYFYAKTDDKRENRAWILGSKRY